jgi:hypothetical protein
MPYFDTRKPREPNEPNRFRVELVASKLRTLLISSVALLFVTAAVTVGLLIYVPSWLSDQDQGSSQREVGSGQQTSDEPTLLASVGRCADKGSTVGQQDGVGNVLQTLAGLLAEAGVRGECIHLLCFWIGLQWYRDPRGPRLYSGLGDCPNNPILSLPSPQKMSTPYIRTPRQHYSPKCLEWQILRNSLASGSAAALCPLSWND